MWGTDGQALYCLPKLTVSWKSGLCQLANATCVVDPGRNWVLQKLGRDIISASVVGVMEGSIQCILCVVKAKV